MTDAILKHYVEYFFPGGIMPVWGEVREIERRDYSEVRDVEGS